VPAALPEQGRLLITGHAGDGQVRAEVFPHRQTELPGTRANLGQERRRHAQEIQEMRIPRSLLE